MLPALCPLADLPKAVVNREPPWVNVFRDEAVTLKCQGPDTPGDHSTRWFHNGNFMPAQMQPHYSFKASNNTSGDYRCQTDQTSLSDPVHLEVFSDWLLLQTPSQVFQEGSPILLRCHSWENRPLYKVTFFHNKKAMKYFPQNSNFSIPEANLSHSGAYHCTGYIMRNLHSSASVVITVQKPESSGILGLIIVVVLVVVAKVAIVVAGVIWFRRRRKRISANVTDTEEAAKIETISVLEAAGEQTTVTMKLGWVLTARVFYFSPMMLWAAQILLVVSGLPFPAPEAGRHAAACFKTLQHEGPVSAQDGGCHTEDDLTDPRELDFQYRGYTFSEPFHLIVSYDWLILRGPAMPVFEGDPLVLHCQAWQDWPLTQVTFYRDGSALGPPGPHREFSIAAAQEGDSGHYHCSGVFKSPGPGSPETASSVAITIQELFPAPVLRATPSAEPTEGGPVTLSCQTKLSPQRSAARLLFSFYKDGIVVRGRDFASEFQIPTAAGAHSGSYWCEVATKDGHVRKQSPKLELRVQEIREMKVGVRARLHSHLCLLPHHPGLSNSVTPSSLHPAPQKSAAPEPINSRPPQPVPSSEDPGFSSPLRMPDPHLYHQMGVLLKQMQDVRVLLGYLLMELRSLSHRLKLETPETPAKEISLQGAIRKKEDKFNVVCNFKGEVVTGHGSDCAADLGEGLGGSGGLLSGQKEKWIPWLEPWAAASKREKRLSQWVDGVFPPKSKGKRYPGLRSCGEDRRLAKETYYQAPHRLGLGHVTRKAQEVWPGRGCLMGEVSERLKPLLCYHSGSIMWVLTTLLLLVPSSGQGATLEKPILSLHPPWTTIFKGERVTLRCDGYHPLLLELRPISTLWYLGHLLLPSHKKSIEVQTPGVYRCQTRGAPVSDPIHLSVSNDWLILQVPYAAVFEGEPLVLRCRGWYDKAVYKLHYYHDGQAIRYFHSSANYTVPQARASDSGRYQCSGTMRIPVESAPLFSAKVAVTVQEGGDRALGRGCKFKQLPGGGFLSYISRSFVDSVPRGHSSEGGTASLHGACSPLSLAAASWTPGSPHGDRNERDGPRTPAAVARTLSLGSLSAELFQAPVLRVLGPAQARGAAGGGAVLRCDTHLHPQKRDTPLQFAFYKYSRPVRRFDWGAEYTVPELEHEELESYWCEAATATRSVRKRSPWLQLPGRVVPGVPPAEAASGSPRVSLHARSVPGCRSFRLSIPALSPPRPPHPFPFSPHPPCPLPHPGPLRSPPTRSLHTPLPKPWEDKSRLLGVAFTASLASPLDSASTSAPAPQAAAVAPGSKPLSFRKPPVSRSAPSVTSLPNTTSAGLQFPAAGRAPTAGPACKAPSSLEQSPGPLKSDMDLLLREMQLLKSLLTRVVLELKDPQAFPEHRGTLETPTSHFAVSQGTLGTTKVEP
ncbi:Fc receptor-like A [Galemys pyrenaicus]|uniref:High affinity immunoglobulin gamma Fc receptor I n=1 Tax=Galemys pyrenaicus TaxID=202257 RepID=A0A8J6A8B0_GALPY|nr:Fc receptor-like A [Galemys pyrenaicus]